MPTIDPDDINERLAEMADEPASAEIDGQKAANQPIPDVIALQQHAAAVAATTGTNQNGGPLSGWGCLGIARVKPPGTI